LVKGPGTITLTIDSTTIAPAASRARGRQGGDGRRPVGNNGNRKVPMSPTAGTHVQELRARTRSGLGNDPRLVTNA
jgi:hypothetical protein